jgi:hypothetical protein
MVIKMKSNSGTNPAGCGQICAGLRDGFLSESVFSGCAPAPCGSTAAPDTGAQARQNQDAKMVDLQSSQKDRAGLVKLRHAQRDFS